MTLRLAAVATALFLTVAGCAAAGDASVSRTELTVFAASSLTEAFDEIGERFSARHQGVDVTFSYASSATAAQQIVRGAPGDVFAAASPPTMRTVTKAGLAEEPAVFARNRLQIAVPAGNPAHVHTLADLARPEVTVAFCAVQAPCGAATVTALKAAKVRVEPDTYGKDVRAVTSMLVIGEVDAALIYHTDVVAAGEKVAGIEFPEAAGAINDYQIAPLRDAGHPKLATAFVRYVRSEAGQSVLRKAGFARP